MPILKPTKLNKSRNMRQGYLDASLDCCSFCISNKINCIVYILANRVWTTYSPFHSFDKIQLWQAMNRSAPNDS